MNQVFCNVSVSGIIKPGEIYTLIESMSREFSSDGIDLLYTIRTEEEIIPALDMEICVVYADLFELRKFLEIRKISDDCHEFKMLCYNKEEECEVEESFYLHRIWSFEEMRKNNAEIYSE